MSARVGVGVGPGVGPGQQDQERQTVRPSECQARNPVELTPTNLPLYVPLAMPQQVKTQSPAGGGHQHGQEHKEAEERNSH
eukprot:13496543-Alexandrium_andersonii.AAC.1